MTRLGGVVVVTVACLAGAAWAGDPAPPGVGLTCRSDRGCPGYLRCRAGRCAVPPAVTGQARPGTPRVVFEVSADRRPSFQVEVADDDWERERGLMFRERLASGWGMLFLYPTEQLHSFWMKNTYVALDLVFLGPDGHVRGVVARARPLDPAPLAIGTPSRDVLELPAGAARKAGIRAGVAFHYVGVVRPP